MLPISAGLKFCTVSWTSGSFTAVINHTRPSAEKRLHKTYVLVDVNHLRLLADLPEKRVQSETLQWSTRKNYNLLLLCTASSLNTLALNIL